MLFFQECNPLRYIELQIEGVEQAIATMQALKNILNSIDSRHDLRGIRCDGCSALGDVLRKQADASTDRKLDYLCVDAEFYMEHNYLRSVIEEIPNYFSNLRRLQLHLFHFLHDGDMAKILPNLSNLEHLKLTPLSNKSIGARASITNLTMYSVAIYCPRIRILELDGNTNFDEEGVLTVGEHCKGLTFISVSDTKFECNAQSLSDGRENPLVALFRSCPSLRIASCRMNGGAASSAAQSSISVALESEGCYMHSDIHRNEEILRDYESTLRSIFPESNHDTPRHLIYRAYMPEPMAECELTGISAP
jgi:hypothetical protein